MALALWWGLGAFIKMDYEAAGIPGLNSVFHILRVLLTRLEVNKLFMQTEAGRSSLR